MPLKHIAHAAPTSAEHDSAARRDCAGLTLDLDHEAALTRRWAARDLAACPAAAPALAARLRCEPDRSVREVIFSSLTAIGNEAAVAGMVRCLRSEQAALRNEAIDSLKQLPLQVAPVMNSLLQDADPDVRIFAINILESLGHPDVERWLIAVIERDAEVNVCGTAVDLLSELGSPAARPALLQLKLRFADEPYIQFACDLVLQRLSST